MLEEGRSAPSASRQVVVLAAVLALLLALLALTTALAGGSRFGDARTGGIVDGPLIQVDQAAEEPAEQQTEELAQARPPRWLPVLAVLLVALVLALAVRALMRAGAARVEQGPAPPVGDAEGDAHALVLDDLRTAARAAAGEVRRDAAGTADAVVRCWERLEQHGERLGSPRGAHQTPTEYGSDLLRRHGADPDAVDELLHLYHRARFGRTAVPEGAAPRAAEALERVAETLQAPAGTGGTGG